MDPDPDPNLYFRIGSGSGLRVRIKCPGLVHMITCFLKYNIFKWYYENNKNASRNVINKFFQIKKSVILFSFYLFWIVRRKLWLNTLKRTSEMILNQVKNENEIQSTYSNAENFSKDMFSFFGIIHSRWNTHTHLKWLRTSLYGTR